MKHPLIGGIIEGVLVIAGDRLMPQEFSSALMSHIHVLDFRFLCILSPAAAGTER